MYKEKIVLYLKKYYKAIIYLSTLLFLILGVVLKERNISLISVVALFISNVVFALIQRKNGYAFFVLFHSFIFLFILSRPIIDMVCKNKWGNFTEYTIFTSLFILLLSLISLDIGFNRNNKKQETLNSKIESEYVSKMRKILFIISLLLLTINLIKEIMVMIHFYGDYISLYTGESANIPFVIDKLSSFASPFLYIYLAFLPSKKYTFIVLCFYLLTGIPGIIIGGRNALMMKMLFALIYVLARHYTSGEDKWVKKKHLIISACLIPIMVISLSVVNYARADEKIPTFKPVELTVDFLHKQGTSFTTLCETVKFRNRLRDDRYLNYTFGGFIDFIIYNDLSNKLFGTPELNGNSIENATLSNNLAHRVSYLALGDQYLAGHGRGTTYFSEIYLDFGYLGIIIFNYLLGYLFKKLSFYFSSGLKCRVVMVNMFLFLFMLPRVSIFSVFSFITSYYFWLTILCVYFLIKFYKRKCLNE